MKCINVFVSLGTCVLTLGLAAHTRKRPLPRPHGFPNTPSVPSDLVLQPTYEGCAANIEECLQVTNLTTLEQCKEVVESVGGCEFSLKRLRAFIPPSERYQCHLEHVWGLDLSALSGYTILNNVRIRGLWGADCQDPVFAYASAFHGCMPLASTPPSSLSRSTERGDLIIEFNGLDISNTTRYLFTRPSCPLKSEALDDLVLSLSLSVTPQNEGVPYDNLLLQDLADGIPDLGWSCRTLSLLGGVWGLAFAILL